jgi:hypothetical protein
VGVGKHPFHGRVLVTLEDGEWPDVAIWSQEMPDLTASHDLPPSALLDRLDGTDIEILGQERGVLASELNGALTYWRKS